MLILKISKELLEYEMSILPVAKYIIQILILEVNDGIRNQLHLLHKRADLEDHQSKEDDTETYLDGFNDKMRGDDMTDIVYKRLVELVLSTIDHIIVRRSNQLVEG